MTSEIEQYAELRKSGKVHLKLRKRMQLLACIACASLAIVGYDVFWKHLSLLPTIGFIAVGFILGFFFFTKLSKIDWDDEAEVVKLGKFDAASAGILVMYIAYRLFVHYYLAAHFDNSVAASGYSFATLLGGGIGRITGMLWRINRTHRENNLPA